MKPLLTLAALAAFSLASTSSGVAQDLQFNVGPRGLSFGTPHRYDSYGYNSYDRRLSRFNNERYNNYSYRNRGRNRAWSNFRNQDFYGRNRGRVNDYRNYYRSNPTRSNRWYNSRPGISIGNGRAGFYYSF